MQAKLIKGIRFVRVNSKLVNDNQDVNQVIIVRCLSEQSTY